jgi:hypothetical protein
MGILRRWRLAVVLIASLGAVVVWWSWPEIASRNLTMARGMTATDQQPR